MMTAFDYESIPAGYYDGVFRRGRGGQSKWHHLKFAAVREVLGRPERHLDIGCGPGTFIGTLDPAIISIGVDVSSLQIDYASRTYGAQTRSFMRVESGAPLQLPGASFDVVTMIEVMEHIPHETTLLLLREAYRLLRPGGRLIVTTPNYGSAWPVLEWLVDRLTRVCYEEQHITHFRKRELFQIIERAGFRNASVRAFQGLAPFMAVFAWDFADRWSAFERWIGVGNAGFLLLGEGVKSDEC